MQSALRQQNAETIRFGQAGCAAAHALSARGQLGD